MRSPTIDSSEVESLLGNEGGPSLDPSPHDEPCDENGFRRNVRRCRTFLGIGLAVSLGLAVCNLIDRDPESPEGYIWVEILAARAVLVLLSSLAHMPKCDKAWARARDARTKAIKELVSGIKVIKPYMKRRIELLREEECRWQRWRYTLGTIINIVSDQIPVFSILVSFVWYTKVEGNALNPATAFVALSVVSIDSGPVIDQVDGLSVIPDTLQRLLTAKIALDRLVQYINGGEIAIPDVKGNDGQIQLANATITWPGDDNLNETRFKLDDLTVTIPPRCLTLLLALLGEARVLSGSVVAPRSAPDSIAVSEKSRAFSTDDWLDNSVAYAPQQSYIIHGTIRDNILFGQPLWQARYQETLRQASLLPDLEILADGDMTEVGEKGVTLSGGQKARINLARCIYSRASTVYLDDILSAVDAHTAQYIYAECLTGDLLRGRTVVLVSHQITLCRPAAEYLIAIEDGRLAQAGPAREIDLPDSPLAMGERLPFPDPPNKPEDEEEDRVASHQIYQAEHRAKGRVASNHYFLVLATAGGLWYWLVFSIIYSLARGMDIGQAVWMRKWSGDPNADHLDYNLVGYFVLVSGGTFLGGLRWIWLYGMGSIGFYSGGSKKIHAALLSRVCSATLQFFETTPAGRLMNIFGQDIWRLDSSSADDFGSRFALFFHADYSGTVSATLEVGTAAIIVCTQTPVGMTFTISLYVRLVNAVLTKKYGKTSLRRKKAEHLSLVPTSHAVPQCHRRRSNDQSVRIQQVDDAFGHDDDQSAAKSRTSGVCRYESVAMKRLTPVVWNFVRGIVRAVISLVSAMAAFIIVGRDISGAQAGFILTYAITASGDIQTPHQEDIQGVEPGPDWPTHGHVRIENLRVRYANHLPEILHGVSVDIQPGQRIGIVGATGSGKSTLALSIFRAMEACGGRIVIDGKDINHLALPRLRERLNMVAQDGTLCSGSLREALDITQTKDGSNFSQGQRQLLCLARALLKDSKVLVMDEATSSVDFEMDAKITATLKESFVGTTTIVIAHRLATVMGFDRVLVLDQGNVLEYAPPRELIRDPASAFHGLCKAAGREEYEKLAALAYDG
ncbi:hypothetical protein P7C73_g3272, partial [Tremellales sp. Uapishka_1]